MAAVVPANADHLLIPAATQSTYAQKRVAALHSVKARASKS